MYKIIGGDGKEYGPVSAEVLRQWIAQGRAHSQTKAMPEGGAEWKGLAELPEFMADFVKPPAATPFPVAVVQPSRINPLAITGMILGLCSILCCCYGFPVSLAGILCSSLALAQISRAPHTEHGTGMAIAGLVLSVLSLLFGAVFFGLSFAPGSHEFFRRIHRL